MDAGREARDAGSRKSSHDNAIIFESMTADNARGETLSCVRTKIGTGWMRWPSNGEEGRWMKKTIKGERRGCSNERNTGAHKPPTEIVHPGGSPMRPVRLHARKRILNMFRCEGRARLWRRQEEGVDWQRRVVLG